MKRPRSHHLTSFVRKEKKKARSLWVRAQGARETADINKHDVPAGPMLKRARKWEKESLTIGRFAGRIETLCVRIVESMLRDLQTDELDVDFDRGVVHCLGCWKVGASGFRVEIKHRKGCPAVTLKKLLKQINKGEKK